MGKCKDVQGRYADTVCKGRSHCKPGLCDVQGAECTGCISSTTGSGLCALLLDTPVWHGMAPRVSTWCNPLACSGLAGSVRCSMSTLREAYRVLVWHLQLCVVAYMLLTDLSLRGRHAPCQMVFPLPGHVSWYCRVPGVYLVTVAGLKGRDQRCCACTLGMFGPVKGVVRCAEGENPMHGPPCQTRCLGCDGGDGIRVAIT